MSSPLLDVPYTPLANTPRLAAHPSQGAGLLSSQLVACSKVGKHTPPLFDFFWAVPLSRGDFFGSNRDNSPLERGADPCVGRGRRGVLAVDEEHHDENVTALPRRVEGDDLAQLLQRTGIKN